MESLPLEFYEKDTLTVAQLLLGCNIVREAPEGMVIGKIVETEAYTVNDPANHAYKGLTKRNKTMFSNAGAAYIYTIYGKYLCLNIVTNKSGIGEAVLLRALEPIHGLALMAERRRVRDSRLLCKGPARLTIALGITKNLDGHSLSVPPLYIVRPANNWSNQTKNIVATTRVGISVATELPYRFYLMNNIYISKK